MAITTSDKRVVRVTVTNVELTTLLGQKAFSNSLIDFIPESMEVINNGDSYELVFEINAGVITP